MVDVQEVQSTLKSESFLPEDSRHDMESSSCCNKVLNDFNEIETSSSGQRDEKLPYACDICSKAFSRKNVLIRHIKFHLGKKPFKCDVCEKTFVEKSDLKRHFSIHSKSASSHVCTTCSKVFFRKQHLKKHMLVHVKEKKAIQYNCDQCKEVFSRKYELLKHRKIHKSCKQYECDQCNEIFTSKFKLFHHVRTSHISPPKHHDSTLKDTLYEKVKHFKRQNVLNTCTQTVINSNEDNDKDFYVFFNSIRSDVLNELNYQIEEKKAFKWYATVQVIVSRSSADGDSETGTPYFRSNTTPVLNSNNLSDHIEDAFAKITDSFEKFNERGSAWILDKILYLEVSTVKYGPF